ncbi:MAG: DNA primase [Minisyncoccia bacterium]
MSSVDQIKSKIDIVTLISSYMKLEKAGSNWKGKCPFHNEKTPSFFVSPDRGSYYCFGCQAKGDIFTFVEEFEGLDFLGALKVLAEKAGVELERFNGVEKNQDNHLFSVLEQATFFYQKNLSENKTALDYLRNRGVKEETIKEFRLGFALDEWRSLYDFLTDRAIKPEEMLSVGLIKEKDGNTKKYYDTFRGRVIFPISDSSGRVVGFSGRIINSEDFSVGSKLDTGQVDSPKYLNSPETKFFKKSEILFGLDKAKREIRQKDYSILVEGQMDLILMHQIGLKNTVATSGTALTETHLVKLKRLSDRITFSFDSDLAGFSASDRSAKIAIGLGMDLKIVQMPDGKDPAELAKDDPKFLRECLKNSKSIVDFYVDTLLAKDLSPKDLAIEIRKKVLPYIAGMSEKTYQSLWINSIKRKTFLNEEALWDDLKKISLNQNSTIDQDFPKTIGPPFKDRIESIERKVFGFLLWIKGNKVETEGVVLKEIEDRLRDISKDRFDKLIQKFEEEKTLLLFEVEAYYNNKKNLSKEVEELLLGLEEEYLKKDFGEAMISLQKAEQKKNSSDVLKYFEECHRISQRINTLKTIRNAYEK